MRSSGPIYPDLHSLVGIFYEAPETLADFQQVGSSGTPEPYRQLLDHQHHMTVTVEAFHQCPVDVRVLAVKRDANTYSREILLVRQSDGDVVQFGIVRLHWAALPAAVREEIEAGQIPLGRVLITHNVWRQVERHQLYRVTCGPDLAKSFRVPEGTVTYGRTALIYCDGEPAIELLEVVSPA